MKIFLCFIFNVIHLNFCACPCIYDPVLTFHACLDFQPSFVFPLLTLSISAHPNFWGLDGTVYPSASSSSWSSSYSWIMVVDHSLSHDRNGCDHVLHYHHDQERQWPAPAWTTGQFLLTRKKTTQRLVFLLLKLSCNVSWYHSWSWFTIITFLVTIEERYLPIGRF